MPRHAPKVTLQDVAARAGVSATAVSLALRGRPGISETTRERIVAVAEEMDYRAPGRGRVMERPGTVAVVLRDIVSVFSHDVVAGMEAEVERSRGGLRLLFIDGRGDEDHLRAEFRKLTSQKLEGIVLFSTAIPPEELREATQRTPVVIVARMPHAVPGTDIVRNDDLHGAGLAVEHLAGLGHSRIAHLARGTLRVDGYSWQMEAAGLGRHTQIEGGSLDSLRPAIRYLLFSILQETHSPTAVFVETDGVAIDFIGAAVDAGLRVPEDVSVVGYDSTRQTEMIRPRLTSVAQPRHEMGRAAIRLLQERRAGRTEDREVVLRPSLDLRDSTAPPREASPVRVPSSLTARGGPSLG
ncbi:LacI family DNA-binding transcriptional regulator [Brachybacterium sp.]|uniref:LacI family DNA-binding transcriptional regulator n=1 Tax=Brachybacterium sp. TaxID=1891286 RepID=UPI002ED2F724